MKTLIARLDPAYEPLTWARAQEIRALSRVAQGELSGQASAIADGVRLLVDILEYLVEDHSPLDWARVQQALGSALQALGEASESDAAYDQAQAAFDRALRVYDRRPALTARSTVANNRAACLARRAERKGDLAVLGEAEEAFKAELTAGPARHDPLAWAVAQMNLARLYEARDEIRGRADDRDAALLALHEALEVFLERGLKGLAEGATAAIERLKTPERAAR
jgi:tetratricopeptide (TPR) repeat protein